MSLQINFSKKKSHTNKSGFDDFIMEADLLDCYYAVILTFSFVAIFFLFLGKQNYKD